MCAACARKRKPEEGERPVDALLALEELAEDREKPLSLKRKGELKGREARERASPLSFQNTQNTFIFICLIHSSPFYITR